MCCFNNTNKEWVPPQVFLRDSIPYAPGHGILIEHISFVNGI